MKKRLTLEQRKILTDRSVLYNRLPEDLKTNLEGLMHVFLHEVTFDREGFVEVTEEMRICVAAEACVLILPRGYDSYSQFRRVVIHKGLDMKWKKWKIKTEGLLAQVLEHEIDHLNGIMYFDHLVAHNKGDWHDGLVKIQNSKPENESLIHD